LGKILRLFTKNIKLLFIISVLTVFIGVIIFGSFGAVLYKSNFDLRLSYNDFTAIQFTLLQAFLSSVLSCFFAVPVARALARRQFIFKSALISFLGAPFILPVIIAIIGFVAIFGRAGFINSVFVQLGIPTVSIYGLQGILIVHVFFNLPLAVRLILNGWFSIPSERFRLSAQLNLKSWSFFKLVELPMLLNILPSIFLVIFLICLSSFVVALTLGGGPQSTTIELAIYQAFRFDFDLAKASFLAMVQFLICLVAVLLAMKIPAPNVFQSGLDRQILRWDVYSLESRVSDFILIWITVIFIALPIAAICSRGVLNLFELPIQIWSSAGRSLIMALFSASFALILALSLAYAAVTITSKFRLLFESVGYFSLALSPLVMGTGLFIIILPLINPTEVALEITVVVNALMAVPFVLRIIIPPLRATFDDFLKLSKSVGLSEWCFFKFVILPRLAEPIGFSLGLAAAISVGDFGVIALFSPADASTLPMALYSLMSAYRMDLASATAVVLLFVSFILFYFFDQGGKYFARSKWVGC